MGDLVLGVHHITLVAGNYELNRRFYTGVLGLRQVKLSVNQDDIFHRHAFYANPERTTGSTITFFEWPHLASGYPGLGSPHHLAYEVASIDVLARWRAWLSGQRLRVSGPHIEDDYASIYFMDHDGTLIEVTAYREDSGADYILELFTKTSTPKSLDAGMALTGFHHATPIILDDRFTARFLEKFLGLGRIERGNGMRRYLLAGDRDKIFLKYLVHPDASVGFVGRGSIHHIALAVESEEDQRLIMRRLTAASIRHSGIIDRFWFKSLYFRDPDGNLMEIATVGPGYYIDEQGERLGGKLALPPWLESRRQEIEARLAMQDAQNPALWPPKYGETPEWPEYYDPEMHR
ncbi:MAG: VOC family protein [Nitrososphaerota archaeon]